jgi:predicted metal-binding membrane protein
LRRRAGSVQNRGTLAAILTLRDRRVAAASLILAALLAWAVTISRMRGMDAGPGTDLGTLGWYLGIWVTMMAAMMLPSALPMVLLFARINSEGGRGRDVAPVWTFVGGYLLAWVGYGLVAYAIYRGVHAAAPSFLAWDADGPYVAGGALVVAGLYQLGPLKTVCLRHCRSPLHFVLHRWRHGWTGAMRMGTEHGAYCVGCCGGLMLALFALGVMSLVWMGLVAAAIFAEKLAPSGERVAVALAVALIAVGIWVAAEPGSVPGLTQPHSMQIQMDR